MSPIGERVSFCNTSGESLVGDLELPVERKPEHIVVICHGFLGSRQGGGRAAVLATKLAGAGYGSLCFDFAGSGESGGSFAAANLTKNTADLRAALDFLNTRGYRKFVALGRSFGGNAVLLAAAGERRLEGVCLWSTPVDMAAVIRKILGEQLYQAMLRGESVSINDGGRTYAKETGFLQDLNRYRMPDLVAALSPRPILIVHGENDELVPFEDAERMFQAAGDPRQLAALPGGNHHLGEHQGQATQITLDWLNCYF